MKVFVDTNFWVAKLHRDDQWHEAATDAEYRIALAELVTTTAVLIETLNYFSSFRSSVKTRVATAVSHYSCQRRSGGFRTRKRQPFEGG